MKTKLRDGLYAVVYDGVPPFCAGFIVVAGEVVEAAPILRRKLAYWIGSPFVRQVTT